MQQELKNIKLTEIEPNPHNFRNTFEGPKFEEMVASILQKGVIQPILVRPVGKKFELVFGERRLRAARAASKKKAGKKTIPALVRKLSDSEAYDLMVVENLQREDLTEYEEAKGFKAYLDKNGNEALQDLADRTGISAAYIRRRVSVLKLPDPILEAWNAGRIRYGYLEQLARLDDETAIMQWFEEVMDGYSIDSVKDLKRHIDNEAVDFKCAVFDLQKAGCLGCNSNTDVQLKLFDIDTQKTKCLKSACFKDKQIAWLSDHWKESSYYKKYKTNGFRFTNDLDHRQCNLFIRDSKPAKACFKCDAFVTGFSGLQLNVHFDRLCIGESGCFKKSCQTVKKSESVDPGGQKDDGAGQGSEPRVAWHGVHFREIFYKEALPRHFEKVEPGEAQAVRLALFALLKSSWELKRWFLLTYAGMADDYFVGVSDKDLFKPISGMDLKQANEALKAATFQMVMFEDFLAEGRRQVADHIGIDLSSEWAITEEYLSKKHIPEILGIGERHGIFSDSKAQAYLKETIKKKDFNKCKKGELVQIFLESGVDLVGKVPSEIVN